MHQPRKKPYLMKTLIPETDCACLNADINEIKLFLEGKIVPAPSHLIETLEASEFSNKKKELAIRQYDLIKRRTLDYDNEINQIYHKCLYFGASATLANDVKKWLKNHGFVEFRHSYSNAPSAPKCISYTANNFKKESFYSIPGVAKLSESSFTQSDLACKYTRQMIGKLTLDVDAIACQIHSQFISSRQDCLPRWLRANASRVVELVRNVGVIKRGLLGNRLYSPFVNLKKSHRLHFSFENQKMYTLDMAAAHPTLLANLAKDNALLDDCLADEFYQKMPSFRHGGRDAAKQEYFCFAYGRMNSRNPAFQMMSNNYPKALSFIARKKSDNYRIFSHFMQQQESHIWIDQIYYDLIALSIPALTIHDAVYVCEKNRAEVSEIIKNRMAENNIHFLLRVETHE